MISALARRRRQVSPRTTAFGEVGRPFDRRGPFLVGFTGALGVACAIALAYTVVAAGQVLVLLGLAFFIAVGLDPVVLWLYRRGVPRWAAVCGRGCASDHRRRRLSRAGRTVGDRTGVEPLAGTTSLPSRSRQEEPRVQQARCEIPHRQGAAAPAAGRKLLPERGGSWEGSAGFHLVLPACDGGSHLFAGRPSPRAPRGLPSRPTQPAAPHGASDRRDTRPRWWVRAGECPAVADCRGPHDRCGHSSSESPTRCFKDCSSDCST